MIAAISSNRFEDFMHSILKPLPPPLLLLNSIRLTFVAAAAARYSRLVYHRLRGNYGNATRAGLSSTTRLDRQTAYAIGRYLTCHSICARSIRTHFKKEISITQTFNDFLLVCCVENDLRGIVEKDADLTVAQQVSQSVFG